MKEIGRERTDLRLHGIEVPPWVGRRAVENVHESPRPLDVAQEALAETRALRRALDEAGNVGDHHAPGLAVGDAQLRIERREWIGRDFGPRRGHRPQQG